MFVLAASKLFILATNELPTPSKAVSSSSGATMFWYILLDVFILEIDNMFSFLQRRKVEKIINARLRKDIGLTFKPEINQKSIELCKQVRILHADSFYLDENLKLESSLSSSFSQIHCRFFSNRKGWRQLMCLIG